MGAGASDYLTPYADVSHGFLDAELAFDDLHALAARGRHHRVRIRLKQGLDPNAARRDARASGSSDSDSDSDGGGGGGDAYARGDTPLICAARGVASDKGSERHVRTMAVLVAFGAAIDRHNRLQQTALLVACDRNALAAAEWLVRRGADVNRPSKSGDTPLMCAHRHENAALVGLLLAHGAVATRPPRQWSCLKFPSLLDHMAASEAEARAPADAAAAAAADDGADTVEPLQTPPPPTTTSEQPKEQETRSQPAASTPACRWRLPRVATSSDARPRTSPADSSRAAARATGSASDPGRAIAAAVAAAVEREYEARARRVEAAADAQRVEEQRVYHAQLASESRTRRARRRARREAASRQRQEAAAGRKMESATAAVRRAAATCEASDRAQALERVEPLAWERVDGGSDGGRQSRSQSRSQSRPRWVAQTLRSAAPARDRRQESHLAVLRDCQALLDAIQRAKDRRERLMAVSDAGADADTAASATQPGTA